MIKLNILGLKWDEKNKKLISGLIKVPKADIRTLKQEKNVLMEPKDTNRNIYYMFRDVHAKEDEKFFRRSHIRYDITIIPPYNAGKEKVKTLGHYHPYLKGRRIAYPEIYEVISGEGMFLIQKKEGMKIKDVVLFHGIKGDKIIIPPGYGHITINPSDKTLIMSNLVSDTFNSIYLDILKKHGAAYYGIIVNNKMKFIKNRSYREKTVIRRIQLRDVFNLVAGKSIYELFTERPHKFDFLNRPYLYKKQFNEIIKEKEVDI